MTGFAQRTRRRAPVPGDVVSALADLGCTDIRVNGDEAMTLCPYHDDRKIGNFSVNITNGVNHCFSCGESGQFIRIVQETTAWPYEKAALWCQTRAGKRRQDDDEPVARSDKVDTTKQMNEAKLSLFTDPPEAALRNRHLSLAAAREYGVLWDEDTWVLPIRDPDTGELWGWQRKGTDGQVRNRPRGVDKSRTLFGLDAVKSASAVTTFILVESPLDCVRFRTAGVPGCVSSFGVHVSDEQLSLLIWRAEQIVLAFDNDDSGSRISERLCREFHGVPFSVYHYGRSRAKDPGEQQDEELWWGLEHATPAWRTRF